jgi:hypothetical protein
MKIQAYLIISSGGGVEIRKTRPRPTLGHVAVFLSIDISNAWFEQVVPVANLTIPDAHVLPMPVVTTELPPEVEESEPE